MEDKIYRVKFRRRDPITDKIVGATVLAYKNKSYSKALDKYKELSKATKERALEARKNYEKSSFLFPALPCLYREVWIEEGTPKVTTVKKYSYKRIEIS